MTPERWRVIDELFHSALRLRPAERAEFLNSACPDDETVRRELESLLALEEEDSEFLGALPSDVVAGALEAAHTKTIAGRKLGHYQILSRLGSGGMGEVYLGEDTSLNRKVAVKFLRRNFTRDPEQVQRFKQEAHSASSLNHPNIITVFEIGQMDEAFFTVTEFIDGQTLQQRLAAGPVPVEEALDIAIQIASALVSAHEAGIIHRDIKPANIMLRRDGYIKILDFGVAKLIEKTTVHPDWEVQTQPGYVIGTPRYMSPEQLTGQDVDRRSDLYSLGVVMREITDKPPTGLERIIAKTLARDRDARYQSAHDLLNDLKDLKLDIALQSRESQIKAAQPKRLRRAASIAMVALILVGAGAGGLRFWRAGSFGYPAAKASIAVLPFAYLSTDKDQDSFSDGLTEELLDALTKNPGLRVAGRISSFKFKDKMEDYSVIGKKLNVATLLEGSVRRQGSRAKITVRLIKASDGFTMWSNTFDREMADIFAVQSEIGLAVQDALNVKASSPTTAIKSASPEAYTAYLQGRHFLKRDEKSLEKSAGYFQQAIHMDPGYAPAWEGLGYVRMSQADSGYIPAEQGFQQAQDAVQRALSLDPELAVAHATLGKIKMTRDFDWAGADASYQRALVKDPHNPAEVRGPVAGMVGAGTLARALGHWDEALVYFRRAVDLDPLNVEAHLGLAHTLYYSGHLDEASQSYTKVLELAPNTVNGHGMMSRVLLAQARPSDALTAAQAEPHPAFRIFSLALVYHALALKKDADDSLAELIRKYQADAPYQIAQVYAFRGKIDEAFQWLERAYASRDAGLSEMKGDPLLKTIERDPRYLVFLRKMKLPV